MAKIEIKLKPCPFCGGKATLTTCDAPIFAGAGIAVYVSCDSRRCNVSPHFSTALYARNTKRLTSLRLSTSEDHKQWLKRNEKIDKARDKVRPVVIKQAARIWNRRTARG